MHSSKCIAYAYFGMQHKQTYVLQHWTKKKSKAQNVNNSTTLKHIKAYVQNYENGKYEKLTHPRSCVLQCKKSVWSDGTFHFVQQFGNCFDLEPHSDTKIWNTMQSKPKIQIFLLYTKRRINVYWFSDCWWLYCSAGASDDLLECYKQF